MNHSILRGRHLGAALVALTGALFAIASANAAKPASGGSTASSTIYSGQAVALKIDGVTNPSSGQIVYCDTGALPSAGGQLQVSQSNINFGNGGLTIAHATAFTSGSGPQAESSTTLTGYHVEFVQDDGHHVTIDADFIQAEVSASCEKNGKIDTASKVTIQNLRVNGVEIKVTGKPNQRVSLGDEGWLILNEQVSSGSGNTGDIAVSAIHFLVCHCIEGHIGLVRAGITCNDKPTAPEGDCGKITGGGWITGTPSGAKGTFGMSGGIRRGEYWGHLTFQDHGTGMKVQSTAVTNFQMDPTDPNGRIITYTVTIDGAPGTARLRVVDNGEPGRNDIFDLTLSSGYRAAGDLGGARPGGGNIQLHKCPPGWE